jgi:2-polyprenyl-6-methoxyphenol hydroxylase-like FAD-dependent oxidoreductase
MNAVSSSRTAIVIGGSVAGLLAARVLAEYYTQVVVIERDHFPESAAPRKGVPHGHHVHVLLRRGLTGLEQLFPGFGVELREHGATVVDWNLDGLWISADDGPARPGVRFASDLKGLMCSRELLEWRLRARLRANPGVRFIEGCDVTGLLMDPGKHRLIGVTVRRRGEATAPLGFLSGTNESVRAGLVVDASGRSSRLPDWLQNHGYPAPEEETISSFLGYASRTYQIDPHKAPDWKIALVRPHSPDLPRGGTAMQVEAGNWIVTLAGYAHNNPPTDEAGFLDFTRRLSVPVLYDLICQSRPVTPIHGFQRTENRLRHYERLERFPDGLMVIGDAACAFNPAYGQGMSVAVLEAQTLDACLAERMLSAGDPRLHELGVEFQRRLANVIRTPWLMATGEDFRWPHTVGGKPGLATRLLHRYMDEVLALALDDREIRQAFNAVSHLVRPPAMLFRPGLLVKVVQRMLTRRLPSTHPAQPIEAFPGETHSAGAD